MDGAAADRDSTVLPEHACWALLRGTDVGRLAVVVDGAPDIFPVNYVVDGGTLVFRTDAGTKLDAALLGPVAFEVDGVDGSPWSVVVTGRAEQVRAVDELAATTALPLTPLAAGRKGRFVRVVPGRVSGRSLPSLPR